MRFNYRLFYKNLLDALFAGEKEHQRLTAKRIKSLVVFAVIYIYEFFALRLFMILDDVFFPAYRREAVEKPTFIIGNFRSGTTLLQRLLARDSLNFTALETWEIYLAPTISQRKFFRGVLLAERLIGSPIKKAVNRVQEQVLDKIDFHRVGLREPEEDVGLLLYIWEGLFVWFFFPRSLSTLPYPRFDQQADPGRKRRVLSFYESMVKRHLYYHRTRRPHAPRRVFLSKNPAFSPMVASLTKRFPDARFVYMARHPVEMLPSEINWFAYCIDYFGSPTTRFPYVSEIAAMCRHWYEYPVEFLNALPPQRSFIARFDDVLADLEGLVRRIYEQFGLELSDEFLSLVHAEVEHAKRFVPRAKRSLTEVGLERDEVLEMFRDVIDRFDLKLTEERVDVADP